MAVAFRRFRDKAGADKTADVSKPLLGNFDRKIVFATTGALCAIAIMLKPGKEVVQKTKEATKLAKNWFWPYLLGR